MNTADHIIECLANEGVRQVFGYPGVGQGTGNTRAVIGGASRQTGCNYSVNCAPPVSGLTS